MKHLVTVYSLSLSPASSLLQEGEKTTRLLIPININGTGCQIRFSNRYGCVPDEIKEATVAVCTADGPIIPEQVHIVTFAGRPEVVLTPGSEIISDRIDLQINVGMTLAVSWYGCKNTGKGSSADSCIAVMQKSGRNCCRSNFASDPPMKIVEELTGQPAGYMLPYFRALDIFTEDTPAVISCLGDSITAQGYWYAPLQEKLYRSFPGKIILLRHGISGNRLLTDAEGACSPFGPAALKRAAWDCFGDYGVTDVLLALGGNDIGMGKTDESGVFHPTAEEFAEGLQKLAAIAGLHHVQLSAMTIYPSKLDKEDNTMLEEHRRLFNERLRTGPFKHVVDLDASLKDPLRYEGMKENYHTRDGIHLNRAGGQALADAQSMEKWAEVFL